MINSGLNCRDFPQHSTVFCEAGELLVLDLLRVNYKATWNFGVIEMDVLKRAIDDAFEELRVHWLTCAKCAEDEVS
jgi:hypothetical protein